MLDVTANAAGTAPGYIFAAPYNGPGPSGPEIFNQSGELVWFDPLADEAAATNLQVQLYDGRPVLTWWQGYIPPQGFGEGEEMIYSSSYQPDRPRARRQRLQGRPARLPHHRRRARRC